MHKAIRKKSYAYVEQPQHIRHVFFWFFLSKINQSNDRNPTIKNQKSKEKHKQIGKQ